MTEKQDENHDLADISSSLFVVLFLLLAVGLAMLG